MFKEDFIALGISEELAEKAAEASSEEMKGYVTKSRFNEVNTAKNNAEKSYNEVKGELDNLKASAGDNEALQNQIKTLQEQLKDNETKYASEISEMKMSNAIRVGIGSIAHDADLVASQLDRSKLILQEDGKVSGLDDQLKTLKESKPFLFKEDGGYPNVKDHGESGGKPGGMSTRDLFAEAVSKSL